MTTYKRQRGASLRLALIAIALAALFVGFSEGRHASPGIAGPTTVNLGRKCYSVVDFGADPSGAVDSTSEIQTGLQDTQWKGNIYDGCVFACYFFAAEDGALPGTPSPNFGHITMADRSATSKYDAVDLSGGFYGLGNGGIEGIQIGGPSLYTGSSGGTASSILMLRGSPSPSGGTVYITYAGGVAATYTDRWAISSYDSIYLDGGFYRALGTAVQGLKIGGPSLYGGSDNTGSGGSVFLITTAPLSSGSLVGEVAPVCWRANWPAYVMVSQVMPPEPAAA